ncbi:PREDICTED: uncharacterized protein LOC106821257 [Priapulus caudatus]|uniref:Uncharacterized protein LOC106821257 n=1 Tax=Priapulus caudatus TaxID=37621 RepID=A0ABM1FAJ5_PRICU|nr:PREDICTED: uncharacterized protein LOC106821257 [Priapulus caudatus]
MARVVTLLSSVREFLSVDEGGIISGNNPRRSPNVFTTETSSIALQEEDTYNDGKEIATDNVTELNPTRRTAEESSSGSEMSNVPCARSREQLTARRWVTDESASPNPTSCNNKCLAEFHVKPFAMRGKRRASSLPLKLKSHFQELGGGDEMRRTGLLQETLNEYGSRRHRSRNLGGGGESSEKTCPLWSPSLTSSAPRADSENRGIEVAKAPSFVAWEKCKSENEQVPAAIDVLPCDQLAAAEPSLPEPPKAVSHHGNDFPRSSRLVRQRGVSAGHEQAATPKVNADVESTRTHGEPTLLAVEVDREEEDGRLSSDANDLRRSKLFVPLDEGPAKIVTASNEDNNLLCHLVGDVSLDDGTCIVEVDKPVPVSGTEGDVYGYGSVSRFVLPELWTEREPKRNALLRKYSDAQRKTTRSASFTTTNTDQKCVCFDDNVSRKTSELDWTGMAADDRICRICLDGETGDTLIRPCFCRGTAAWVHRSCLEEWLTISDSYECELCQYLYSIRVEVKPIYKWKRPATNPGVFGPYICLLVGILCFCTPLICYILGYSAVQVKSFLRDAYSMWKVLAMMGFGIITLSLYLVSFAYCIWRFSRLYHMLAECNRHIVLDLPGDVNRSVLSFGNLSLGSSRVQVHPAHNTNEELASVRSETTHLSQSSQSYVGMPEPEQR